ncbi:hypothetical protein DEAC_c40430 [Desulfosporosinus acididurans]|uniref:Uncharacterized protein n=1 Tax=Desulfosporosinus acididurans TaxID=476652 RepID=A0A0J1FKQ0_9FIRM|nr:hypothetical protein DEAC_c40430 [Desulfosporosinus acididurans]
MIKKITRFIQLVKKCIADYRYHKHWAQLMHSGLTVRDHKTLVTVTDDEVVVDYVDGRKIGQKYVNPVYIDSTNWGR